MSQFLNLLNFFQGFFSFAVVLDSCSDAYKPTKYSIEEFYKNNRVGGGSFSNKVCDLLYLIIFPPLI